MIVFGRRPLRPIVVSLAAAVVAALAAVAPATAQPVTAGTFAFSGDADDYISGGQAYSYAVDAGDSIGVTSQGAGQVTVSVIGAEGSFWALDLAAPSGQPLAPGTYPGATRYPFAESGRPSLALYGNGRGCNEVAGSFTVLAVSIGHAGYVERLHATFEQHCDGIEGAARGEVDITNPPAPPRLTLGPLIASTGTANGLNGDAVVGGTVSCSRPADVTVSGAVTQVVKRTLARGTFFAVVPCVPGAPVAWTGTAVPTGATPFTKGAVEVRVDVSAVDAGYGDMVTGSTTSEVTLRKR